MDGKMQLVKEIIIFIIAAVLANFSTNMVCGHISFVMEFIGGLEKKDDKKTAKKQPKKKQAAE